MYILSFTRIAYSVTREVACLKSANEKWKQFKSYLTKEFIFKSCHDPNLVNTLPKDFDIPQADWSQFVINCMSEEFRVKKDERHLSGNSVMCINQDLSCL